MLLLTSVTDLIQVITGSAGDIRVHASWVDNLSGTITPGRTNTASIATAATTTVVASPAASTQRNVKFLSVFNNSGSVSNLVTIQHTDGTNVEILWKGTLGTGESVVLDDEGEWHNYNNLGVEEIATAAPLFLSAFSTATVSASYAADTQLAGSSIALPSGVTLAGMRVRWVFDMVKTAAGIATPLINIRWGTANTVADASVCLFTFAAGTAAVDTGKFTVEAHMRTAGSGTSAVIVGVAGCQHALAATGLTATGASGYGQIATVGGGFNSTVASSFLSLSFNGGTSFSGTCNLVGTEVFNFRG